MWQRIVSKIITISPTIVGVGLLGLATAVGLLLRPYLAPTNIVMIYVVALVIAGVRLEKRAVLIMALLSVVIFDYFFVPPYLNIRLTDAQYLVTYGGLLAVGGVISTLMANLRQQRGIIEWRKRQTTALLALSQKLAPVAGVSAIAHTAVDHFETTFDTSAALFLPTGEETAVDIAAQSPAYQTGERGRSAANWVFHNGQPMTYTPKGRAAHQRFLVPLQTEGKIVGVMALDWSARLPPLNDEQRQFIVSLGNQVALSVDKAHLLENDRQAHLLLEAEKLQTTLLNAVSHELRSPLAVITGALSSLITDAHLLSDSAKKDLLQNAWEESMRLNRLVGNLLDMTRLESGVMQIKCQPHEVLDLVSTALAQMPNQLQNRAVNLEISGDLPMVSIDFSLMIQTLINLVSNAVKYSPAPQPIDITARQVNQMIVISIKDRGPGLPEAELDHIFTKFFRLTGEGFDGTGLGLSIAKGIMEAHHGRIWAENREGGGSVFLMALPIIDQS